jgi:hypothetical protein
MQLCKFSWLIYEHKDQASSDHYVLRFADRASRYNRVKKNQLDSQLILSTFRQSVHVSGDSRLIIRPYNRMYTKIGTYYSF